MFQALIGALCGIGMFLILTDIRRIPYAKTSRAVLNLSKNQKGKTNRLDVWLKGFSIWLSQFIRINEFKKAQLEADLKSAQMEITPELFKADAVVKAALVGVFAIPVLFLFPLLCPVILIMAIFLYSREMKSVNTRIRAKRDKIEYELPRLVFTIDKTLKHNRDVLYMLESYATNSGPELKYELDITVADMRSGNYETALTRLQSRVGSSMMSDVCHGLIGILRGDDTTMYWASLSLKFNDIQRQLLKQQAQKVPGKVRRLSMALLFCFIAIYIVVIITQIMTSLGAMFA